MPFRQSFFLGTEPFRVVSVDCVAAYASLKVRPMPTASILVLEDEDLIRDLLTTVLEDAGFKVTAFQTADQGCDFLETHPGEVNMVVSDIRMPGKMDGYDLSMLAAERWPALPILLTSGFSGRDLVLGPNVEFLPKPWTSERLLTKVNKSLHIH